MQRYGSKHKRICAKSNVLVAPRPPPPPPPAVSKCSKPVCTLVPEVVGLSCMRSLPENATVSYVHVVSRTPSSSSLVSEPVVSKPAPAPVMAGVRVVPEAKPKPVPKPAPAPKPEPVPEPEHPVGTRAWKIKQFIKANFKS